MAPPASSAAVCAAPSMPSARPLVTTLPERANALAKARAFASPLAVALREPTIAIWRRPQVARVAGDEQGGRRARNVAEQCRIIFAGESDQVMAGLVEPAPVRSLRRRIRRADRVAGGGRNRWFAAGLRHGAPGRAVAANQRANGTGSQIGRPQQREPGESFVSGGGVGGHASVPCVRWGTLKQNGAEIPRHSCTTYVRSSAPTLISADLRSQR